jgi:hypothetical protein
MSIYNKFKMGEKLNIQTNLVKNEVKYKKVNKHALKKK